MTGSGGSRIAEPADLRFCMGVVPVPVPVTTPAALKGCRVEPVPAKAEPSDASEHPFFVDASRLLLFEDLSEPSPRENGARYREGVLGVGGSVETITREQVQSYLPLGSDRNRGAA